MTTTRPGRHAPSTSARPGRSHPAATVVGVSALAALGVLSVLVATGRTEHLDDAVSELFRPGGDWGLLQRRVDVVVEGLRPVVVLPLLALLSACVSLLRRSWWPLACTGLATGLAVAGTVGLKAAVGRVDYHGDLGALGGSFPSGHVVTLVVAASCVALLVRERPGRWAWSLVALAAATMSWALLVQTAHWFTDVLGGLLLGTAVVAVAVRLPFTRGGAAPEPDAGHAEPR